MQTSTTRRNKHRLTGKFFIILTILIVLILSAFLIFVVPGTSRVEYGSISAKQIDNYFVVFSEAQMDLPDNERIVFEVSNNEVVQAGDTIGVYYKKGYIASAFEAYMQLQQTIVEYQNEVIKDIYQNELIQYALNIQTVLAEIEHFNSMESNYIDVNARLAAALSQREDYIRTTFPADEHLQSLYDEEAERLQALNDWIVPIVAAGNGFVSWYTHSAYKEINTTTAGSVTAAQLRKMIQNKNIIYNINSSNEFSVRIVSDGFIYLCAVMPKDVELNQTIELYMPQRQTPFSATAISVNGTGNDRVVTFRVECNVSEFIENRVVEASLAPINTGLIVPASYIFSENGQTYVIAEVNGEKQKVFITVMTQEEKQAIVQPNNEGELVQDQMLYTR